MNQSLQENLIRQFRRPLDVLLGRAAMVGFVFAFLAYLTVDITVPGLI